MSGNTVLHIILGKLRSGGLQHTNRYRLNMEFAQLILGLKNVDKTLKNRHSLTPLDKLKYNQAAQAELAHF
eukprot:UN02181